MNTYFMYSPDDGLNQYQTKSEAIEAAEHAIQPYLDECWDESVEQIRVGIVTHSSTKTNLKTKEEHPELFEDLPAELSYICDYEMKPTQATEVAPGKSEFLTRTDVLLLSLEQCLGWAEENKEKEIEQLEYVEVFFENGHGLEVSTNISLFDLIRDLQKKVVDLSHFIQSQPFDNSKCLPNGIPDICKKTLTEEF